MTGRDLATHRRLFTYDAWSNGESLLSLRRLASPPQRAVGILAHLVATKRLWLSRIEGRRPPTPVWPDADLDGCAAELAVAEREWSAYLAAIAPTDLGNRIAYTNTKGESFTNSVDQILTHVVIHGAHHRGQIATLVREAGGEPAYTDFVHAVRQGLVP